MDVDYLAVCRNGRVQITSNENTVVVSAGVVKSFLHVQHSYLTETIFYMLASTSINFMNIEEVLLL